MNNQNHPTTALAVDSNIAHNGLPHPPKVGKADWLDTMVKEALAEAAARTAASSGQPTYPWLVTYHRLHKPGQEGMLQFAGDYALVYAPTQDAARHEHTTICAKLGRQIHIDGVLRLDRLRQTSPGAYRVAREGNQ